MEIVFNEVSLDDIFYEEKSEEHGKEEFDKFVETINRLKKENLVQVFFFPDNILAKKIAYNYTVSDWLSDKTVNSNHRQFFRAFMGHAIFLTPNSLDGEFKFKYKELELFSIGATYAKEYSEEPFVISVVTDSFWKKDLLYGTYFKLKDDGGVLEEDYDIHNITYQTNIQSLKKEQRIRLFQHIYSGQDVWENREKLFPN